VAGIMRENAMQTANIRSFHDAFTRLAVILWALRHSLDEGRLEMDIVVSVFAVLVALGCFIAIILATRKDKDKEKKQPKD
jgi:hypothetical protein